MDAPSRRPQDAQTLSEELRHVHHHLAALHQQGAIMLRMLSVIMNKLNELSSQEEGLEREIGTIESEIAQLIASPSATASCPACGGPLDHHRAASGELHVCSACGFSQFVDSRGMVRNTTTPVALPMGDGDAAPPSWVG